MPKLILTAPQKGVAYNGKVLQLVKGNYETISIDILESEVFVYLASTDGGNTVISTLGDVVNIINGNEEVTTSYFTASLEESYDGELENGPLEDYIFVENDFTDGYCTVILSRGVDEPITINESLYVDTSTGQMYYFYEEDWEPITNLLDLSNYVGDFSLCTIEDNSVGIGAAEDEAIIFSNTSNVTVNSEGVSISSQSTGITMDAPMFWIINNAAVDLFQVAPASSAATGSKGEFRICPDAIYFCIATDTWVKATLATWS